MKLLKATVAIAAVLAPLALGVADASAQERRRMGPPEGQAQAQAPRSFNGGGERGGFRGGGEGRRFGGQDGGSRGQGFQGGQRFQGQGQGGQSWRGQGFRGQGQAQGFQGQAPVAQAPVQPNVQQNFQNRADRRGVEGQRNFRGGGDNRFDGQRNFRGGDNNRFDGQRNFDRGGRDWNNRNDGRGYDRGRNWNDNRGFDNRRGERFSYRGRDFFRFRTTPYAWPRGYAYRSWAPRQILPPLFLADQYYMDDFWTYGLDEPPYGYRWVRVGQDALLVDVYSGEILDVVPGVFYW